MVRPSYYCTGRTIVKTELGDYETTYVKVVYYKIKCPFCKLYIRTQYFQTHLYKRHGVLLLD